MKALPNMRSWTSVKTVSRRFREKAGRIHTIVDGQHTGTSDTTEDVGTSTLEEGSDTLSSHDLLGSVEGALVLDSLQISRLDCACGLRLENCNVPRQKSSSYDDGWYQEGRKRYRHQW